MGPPEEPGKRENARKRMEQSRNGQKMGNGWAGEEGWMPVAEGAVREEKASNSRRQTDGDIVSMLIFRNIIYRLRHCHTIKSRNTWIYDNYSDRYSMHGKIRCHYNIEDALI